MAHESDNPSARFSPPMTSPSAGRASRSLRAPVQAIDAPEPLELENNSPSPKPRAVLSREQILTATEQSLREDGYDKTTIRGIARRLGCAVGSIYRYFDDKRDLLDAVTQRRFEPVAMRIELRSPMERTMQAYVQAAREAPEQYRLMYWLASVGIRDDSPAVPAVVKRIIEGWAQQLGDANRAWRIWAELHGSIMIGIDEQQMPQILAELSIAALPLVAEVSSHSVAADDADSEEQTADDPVPYASVDDMQQQVDYVSSQARAFGGNDSNSSRNIG